MNTRSQKRQIDDAGDDNRPRAHVTRPRAGTLCVGGLLRRAAHHVNVPHGIANDRPRETAHVFDPDGAGGCEPDEQWLAAFERELNSVVAEGGFDTAF